MAQNTRGQMKLDDIEIGQYLIAVEHLGFSRMIHREETYRVVKKLKTRLVIERMRPVEGALVPSGQELRVIVRDGAISSSVEGWGSRTPIDLLTTDDPKLDEYRAETLTNELRGRAVDAAKSAGSSLSRGNALRAVKALQAWLDHTEATP